MLLENLPEEAIRKSLRMANAVRVINHEILPKLNKKTNRMENKIQIKIPSVEAIQRAFHNAGNNPEIQNMLRDLYGDVVEPTQVDNRPVTERIKTLDDAMRDLGDDNPLVQHYNAYVEQMHGNFSDMDDITAFLKLRIIAAALNEGWKPEFTEDEYRYYPWFYLFTEEEIANMTEERKQKSSLVLWGGHAGDGSRCGLGCAHSSYAFSYSVAAFGSRLAVKTSELAKYFGRQFIEIWSEFIH